MLPDLLANPLVFHPIVVAFTCHDQGASSLAYAPQHQLLISAGKKGDVSIFDVRQRILRHRFQVSLQLTAKKNYKTVNSNFLQAHEHPIKCLAIDPNEEQFVTGSADGDIKVSMINFTLLQVLIIGV